MSSLRRVGVAFGGAGGARAGADLDFILSSRGEDFHREEEEEAEEIRRRYSLNVSTPTLRQDSRRHLQHHQDSTGTNDRANSVHRLGPRVAAAVALFGMAAGDSGGADRDKDVGCGNPDGDLSGWHPRRPPGDAAGDSVPPPKPVPRPRRAIFLDGDLAGWGQAAASSSCRRGRTAAAAGGREEHLADNEAGAAGISCAACGASSSASSSLASAAAAAAAETKLMKKRVAACREAGTGHCYFLYQDFKPFNARLFYRRPFAWGRR